MTGSIDRPAAPPQEGRNTRRQRVLLGGKIAYDNGNYTCDCSIRDLSATGARLGIRGGTVLPKYFYLLDLRNGMAYECEVVWRNAAQTGVKFLGSTALSELTDPKLRYLRNLYVEAALR